jgi:hypothetical protein
MFNSFHALSQVNGRAKCDTLLQFLLQSGTVMFRKLPASVLAKWCRGLQGVIMMIISYLSMEERLFYGTQMSIDVF